MSVLPRPVSLPTQQVQAYQNQALQGIGTSQITASPVVNMPGQAPTQNPSSIPTISGRTSLISEGATAAGQARLEALRRRQQSIGGTQGSASGGGLTVPSGGTSGPRTGPYGFTPGAARSEAALSAAYQAKFGVPLVVNSGGRSHEQQAQAYQNYLNGGPLAAPVGHSVHETGNAADFGGAILNIGSPQHQWLEANAGRYGWVWAGKNFAQVEPWHFEYRG